MEPHDIIRPPHTAKRHVLLLLWVCSAMVHLLWVGWGGQWAGTLRPVHSQRSKPFKMKLVYTHPQRRTPETEPKTLLVTPQPVTAPPQESHYLAEVNHTAKTERRAAPKPGSWNGRQTGARSKASSRSTQAASPAQGQTPSTQQKTPSPSFGHLTELSVAPRLLELSKKLFPKAASKVAAASEGEGALYSQFLQNSAASIEADQIERGIKDSMEAALESAEMMDIHTKEYRFAGYFTGLLKAIELVWVYPQAAAHQGMTGKVTVKFIVLKDGRTGGIDVVQSSGYKILDESILKAIEQAAPFAPLPKGFSKERLPIQGTFSYVLRR